MGTNKTMKRLRLSYSLLNAWHWGKKEQALNTYLHIPTEINPAMQRGIDFDDNVQAAIQSMGVFPREIGGFKLKSPEAQKRIEVEYSDKFDLVAVLDVWDNPVIYETKCSSAKDAGEYADDFQIPFYFLTLKKKNIEASKAWIFAYNWAKKQYTTALIWNSERSVKIAEDKVNKYGEEI